MQLKVESSALDGNTVYNNAQPAVTKQWMHMTYSQASHRGDYDVFQLSPFNFPLH